MKLYHYTDSKTKIFNRENHREITWLTDIAPVNADFKALSEVGVDGCKYVVIFEADLNNLHVYEDGPEDDCAVFDMINEMGVDMIENTVNGHKKYGILNANLLKFCGHVQNTWDFK